MDRIGIGFAAGQALTLRVKKSEAKALQEALAAGGSWYELQTDDGPVSLRLESVVYVRTESTESKVGFGSN